MTPRQILFFLVASVLTSFVASCGAGGAGEGNVSIVRVSRQNNSGTYVYFREAVLGKNREYRLGTIDQSGSKDVVALVENTPNAIGYSGMAYATPSVKMLKVSLKKGGPGVAPTLETAQSGSYPIARPLFLYTNGEPKGAVKDYIDWIMSGEGQAIVQEIGYVPVGSTTGTVADAAPAKASHSEASFKVKGSDTMVNLSQAWAQNYSEKRPNVTAQVSGGGSGVGIAGLIDGTVDIATASRKMKDSELALATQKNGIEPKEFIVGRDALAVYVHKDNPLDEISIEELAEIYGEGGKTEQWTQINPNWSLKK